MSRTVVAPGRPRSPRPPLDEERVRADFPILARPARGHRLAYLDTAATAQKPAAVIEAVRSFYAERNANVHRGVHVLGEQATAAYDLARETVRRFLNAGTADEIIFTSGTTAAVNLVAQSWGGSVLQPGDEILVSLLEHHSNLVPWQVAAHKAGAVLRPIPLLSDGSLDLAAFEALLGPRTRMVAVSHVSNVLGTVVPVAHLARLAHRAGALLLVDGAQAVPQLPVDVRALECDFYAFSGHKAYGPMGIGALYGRSDQLRRMPPWITGGGMIQRVTFEVSTWADPPARFEAGTPPVAEAAGLTAALEYLERIGMETVADHARDLTRYAVEALGEVPGLVIYGAAPERTGAISFNLGTIHPHDLATVLDAEGVAVRAGHHCTQPLMDHLGVPATVRASLGVYSTREDVAQLVAALHGARERFSR